MSKVFSSLKFFQIFLIAVLMIGVISCAPRGIKPSPDTARMPVPERDLSREPAEKQEPVAEESNPRLIASLQLTQQARALIETGQADSAIRILEKAVSIDPSNGRNYFYLSKAWLIKGDTEQALNFNELALIHLRSDETWRQRIADQTQRIRNRQSR